MTDNLSAKILVIALLRFVQSCITDGSVSHVEAALLNAREKLHETSGEDSTQALIEVLTALQALRTYDMPIVEECVNRALDIVREME